MVEAHKGDEIAVSFTRDEALVLFDWLVRFTDRDDEDFEDQAEERVLFTLEAALERQLVEPFAADYATLLADARRRVRKSGE